MAEAEWLRGSPAPSASDTASPVFPERPIRPLPKRRLRSRLSEEQQETIVYPPTLSSSSPLFSASAGHPEPPLFHGGDSQLPLTGSANANRLPPNSTIGGYQSELDSDDENEDDAHSRPVSTGYGGPPKGRPNHSAASSGDGYESFENTNNKKKRKIPQNHPSGGLVDDLDLLNPHVPFDELAPGYAFGNSGQPSGVGIAGAGRGRTGQRAGSNKKDRQSIGSPPLTASGAAGLSDIPSETPWLQGGARKGQTTNKPVPNNPQPYPFSFERDSQSSSKLKEAPRPPMGNPAQPVVGSREVAHQLGSQPSGPMPPSDPRTQAGQQPRGQAEPAPQAQPQPPPPSKTQQYKMAAQERRRAQLNVNARYLHDRESVTLCEFCEYKAIWLSSPRHLIRSYEEKDLKRRQELENRRRLLEKAKAKGRKSKKSSKGGKGSSAAAANDAAAAYDDDLARGDTQSPADEYFDDPEYDDGAVEGDDYIDDEYGDYTGAVDPPPPPPPVPAQGQGGPGPLRPNPQPHHRR